MQLVKIKGTGFGVYRREDGRLVINYRDEQDRPRQETKIQKAAEANAFCRRKYREWPGRAAGEAVPYAVGEMVGDYMATREIRPRGVPYNQGGIAENTIARDRAAAARIRARWETEQARGLSRGAVLRWYEAMGKETPELAGGTISGYACTLRAAFVHAMRPDGPLADLPAPPVPPVPHTTRKPGQAFSAEQTWAILDRVTAPYRAFTYTLAFSGMRIEEICRLDVPDFDPTAPELRGGIKTEAGRNRPIAISDNLAAMVGEHVGTRTEGPLFVNRWGRRVNADAYRLRVWRPIVEAVGVEGATPHWFRHTAATLAAEAGASEWEMMSHFGWTDIRQATRYVHLARKGVRRIADTSMPPAPLRAVE